MTYKNICLLPLLFYRHINYCSRTLPLLLFIFSLTTFSSFLHFVLPSYLFPCLPPSISFCLPPSPGSRPSLLSFSFLFSFRTFLFLFSTFLSFCSCPWFSFHFPLCLYPLPFVPLFLRSFFYIFQFFLPVLLPSVSLCLIITIIIKANNRTPYGDFSLVGKAALCSLFILCVVPILWNIRASKSKVKFSATLSVQLLLIHSAAH